VKLAAGSPAAGRTLKSLQLRGHTGATVIAIKRPGAAGLVVPTGDEELRAEDTLFVAGSAEAVAAAVDLLAAPPPPPPLESPPRPTEPSPG